MYLSEKNRLGSWSHPLFFFTAQLQGLAPTDCPTSTFSPSCHHTPLLSDLPLQLLYLCRRTLTELYPDSLSAALCRNMFQTVYILSGPHSEWATRKLHTEMYPATPNLNRNKALKQRQHRPVKFINHLGTTWKWAPVTCEAQVFYTRVHPKSHENNNHTPGGGLLMTFEFHTDFPFRLSKLNAVFLRSVSVFVLLSTTACK